jgi:NADPH:quinone reductase
MRAILITPTASDVASLELQNIEPPQLSRDQIRVAVRAASVNRADLLTRAGAHAPASAGGSPQVAGLDASGDVIEVGSDVSGIKVGDRVMVMAGGGLAEEIVVSSDMAIPVPTGWSYIEGAAAVLGLMTEHDALVTAGGLTKGDVVVVHAATSGVATQGIQLAKYVGAGTILATARSMRADDVLTGLGADALIDTSSGDFPARILDLTNGNGANVILDHVGGPYLAGNLAASAIGGRIIGIGRLGGADGTLDLEELARKRVSIIGVTFRTRTPAEKAEVVAALRRDVDFENATDALRPLIHQTYDWTQALEAQAELAKNAHVGKIVLEVK